MDYQVVVLTHDEVFGRMLELEFSGLALSTAVADRLAAEDRTEIVILDLDSAAVPSSNQYRKMIGFSRRPAMTTQGARSCSMILRRPFQMSLLRSEVLSELEQDRSMDRRMPENRASAERQIRLYEDGRRLKCDGKEIALTPVEFAVMETLLERRRQPVSREDLASLLGGKDLNEVNVFICYLRRKTDGLPGGRLIRTVRGKGYEIV